MFGGWLRKRQARRPQDPKEQLAERLKRCRGRLPRALRRLLRHMAAEESAEAILQCWADLGPDLRQEVKAIAREEGLIDHWLALLKEGSPSERVAAAEILGFLGEGRVTGYLLEALADREVAVQMAAAAALAFLQDARCLPPLVTALAEPRRIPPARVAQILAAFGAESIPYLVRALETGPEEVAIRVIEILGLIAHPGVLPHLSPCLQSPSAAVRAAAAGALGDTGLQEAGKYLLSALDDAEPRVRAAAVTSLGRLRYSEAYPALEQALRDPAWEVRLAARAALERWA